MPSPEKNGEYMMASNNDIDDVHQALANIKQGTESLTQTATAYDAQLAALTKAVNDATTRLETIERRLGINTTPSIAGPKLASIPELLEPILLHLPTRDLLVAQRVNRRFKDIIDHSEAIQKALFFLPETEPAELSEIDVRVNPLLVDEKAYISIPLYRNDDIYQRGRNPVFVKDSAWNSRKLKVLRCEVNTRRTNYGGGNQTTAVGATIVLGRLPGTVCWGRRADEVGCSVGGSWRRMYATQPPLKVVHSFEDNLASASGRADADGTRRFTFGELFDWKVRRMDGSKVDVAEDDI